MDYNEGRISSLSDGTIHIYTIKCVDWSFGAMNFYSTITILTLSARIHISSNPNVVTNFEAIHTGSHLPHNPNNLMSKQQAQEIE